MLPRPFLPPGSQGLEPLPPAPEYGGCGPSFDCCRRRWPGPRARLRITQAPGERVCSHTPEAGVPRASHTGLPKPASRSAARTHAGLPFHPCLSEQLAGPRGIWGRRMDQGLGAPADLQPPSPALVLLLACPGRRLLGTFHLCEAGQGPVSQGQSHEALRWMPGPATEQPCR